MNSVKPNTSIRKVLYMSTFIHILENTPYNLGDVSTPYNLLIVQNNLAEYRRLQFLSKLNRSTNRKRRTCVYNSNNIRYLYI